MANPADVSLPVIQPVTESPARDGQFRSLGRFLYTQNPFYLLSCFLIIYGLQVATATRGDLVSRSLFLTGGIGVYTLLMVLTAIGVIRLGRVWEDGRSILLVVVISIVALSSALDELCLTEPSMARSIAIAAMFGSVLATEMTLRWCRIRLPLWYRASYYAMLLVFFATPIGMGHAVAERYDRFANWGSVVFSCAFAVAMLLLIPAVRRGRSGVRHNGTPWRWPLYPLSAFVVLVVLAGIRTHAIWISFGFFGESLGFEPFLLLPMVLAILVLAVESDVDRRTATWSTGTLYAAPAVLLCGLSRGGATILPIRDDLLLYAGSATTVTLVSLAAFYLYAWLRGVRHGEHTLFGSLVGLGLFADIPEPLRSSGYQPWMCLALGTLIYLWIAARFWGSDWRWFIAASSAAVTVAMIGQSWGHDRVGLMGSAGLMSGSLLAIGYCFDTGFSRFLRYVAAGMMTIAAAASVAWHFDTAWSLDTVWRSRGLWALASVAAVTCFYFWLTKRFAWLYVIATQSFGFAAIGGEMIWRHAAISDPHLPLQAGVACFVIALAITIKKSGLPSKWWPRERSPERLGRFQMGL